jgi:hypothetical protein
VADKLWQAIRLGHHATCNMFTQVVGLMRTAADPAISFLRLSAKVVQRQGVAPPVVGSAVHSNHDQ